MTEAITTGPGAPEAHKDPQARKGPPTASIVIVNYNGRELLPDCLTPTVRQAKEVGAEVIVVDNGSSDGSIELIEHDYPAVRVIEAFRNLGFAEGCNVGVRAAANETIVLLNNDTVPEPHWLERLLAVLAEPSVAVACSVVHDRSYPEAYALGTGSLSVIGHPIANAMRQPDRPFYATGAALAFKRARFAEPFDPLFFAYYEDVVLSWRARLQGHQVARALDSHVQHVGSATAQRDPSRAFYYRERNKLLTLLLCYEASTLLRLLPLYLFDSIARITEDLLHTMKGRASVQEGAPPAITPKYAVLLKALGWLALHAGDIARRRAAIQSYRRLTDAAITPMLSGKIFDDVIPSRAHAIANRIALGYCRLAGIKTVESQLSS